jgi:hypothetical protein
MAREDGTPYGWHNVGGEVSLVGMPRIEGAGALAVISRSSSTKWAYQVVAVDEGRWYRASAWVMAGSAEEGFLRLSWYAAADGSGTALDSVDSTGSAVRGTAEFALLTTGPVQAPAGASIVKLRLMVRPGSDSEVTAYFDAVSLEQVLAPAPGANSTASASSSQLPSRLSFARQPAEAGAPAEAAAVLAATPFAFANIKPAASPALAARGGPGGNLRWLAYVGIAVGGAALVYVSATEVARRRAND